MNDYKNSRWADKDFSERYVRAADDIIQDRRRLIGVLLSFYGYHFGGRERVDVVDLGCGDGTLTRELLDNFPNAVPTLVDASPDMLERAREGLAGQEGARYVRAEFQEIIAGAAELPRSDLVFSSLAVHHLDTAGKAELFALIRDSLREGGWFVNIDVVLPPAETLEGWYLDVWRRWADERGAQDGTDLIARYKGNADNKPDTLETQLTALKYLGYRDADCFYKHGIFAVFGGRK